MFLLVPVATFGQERSGEERVPRERAACDPIWDGAFFGALPGIAAGYLRLIANSLGPERDLDERKTIIIAATAGSAAGFFFDAAKCKPANGKDDEQGSTLDPRLIFVGPDAEGIEQAGEIIPTIAGSANCDPVWDGAFYGILPGVLVTFISSGMSASGTEDEWTGKEALFYGAILGAAVGLSMDLARCNPKDEKNRPVGEVTGRESDREAYDLMAPFIVTPYRFPTSDR